MSSKRRGNNAWRGALRTCSGRVSCAGAVLIGSGGAALCAWLATGNFVWALLYFRFIAAAMTVALAGAAVTYSASVFWYFAPGEPLRKGWGFILGSSALSFLGSGLTQVLGNETLLNALPLGVRWSPEMVAPVRQIGLLIGGPCQFVVLS